MNGSFVSPTADAKVAHMVTELNVNGIVNRVLEGVSGWTIILTILLMTVAYDQCE